MNILFLDNIINIDSNSAFGILLEYIYLFIIGSFLGWIGEILFRRFVSMKKWINPGFLKGPCIPLYGFGLCALHAISELCFYYLTKEGTYPNMYGISYSNVTPIGSIDFIYVSIIAILLIGVGLTLIEYIAGLIFIKGFHIKLWDYSKLKGNIQGIICPQFCLLWLVGGALYWFGLRPFVGYATSFLTEHIWGMTFIIGIYIGILIVDFYSSVKLSISLTKEGKLHDMIVDYEKFKLEFKNKPNKEKKENALLEAIKSSLEPIKKKINSTVTEIKSHMYVNNEIPTTSNESETPRMKSSRLEKEQEDKNNVES